MNIIKNTKNKKLAITLTSVLVIALGAVGVYAVMQQRATNDENITTATREENTVSEEDKNLPVNPSTNQTEAEQTNEDNETGDNKVITPAPTETDGSAPEKPSVTRAEQSGDAVRVSAILSEPSNGTCTLMLKNGSHTVEKSAAVIVGPSYYTCNGFRVPVSELGSGNWTATVMHTQNGSSTTSDRKTITIN